MVEPMELIGESDGRWTLKRAGEPDVADVRVRLAFPWSHKEQFISIRAADGKELLMVEDLRSVDEPARQAILRHLADTSFVPRIQRVVRVDMRFGHQHWTVQTDRGEANFRVQEREDIRFLPDGRFAIKDADGNIYELDKLEKLDPASRKAIEALI